MKTGIKRMHEEKYITDKEYDDALNYDIVADFTEESTTPDEKYPLLVNELQERATNIITEKLMNEDNVTKDELSDRESNEYKENADKNIRRKGYRIHSTINKDIYKAQQQVVKEYEHFGPDITDIRTDEETGETYEVTMPVQTGSVLRENDSGKIISFVGGRKPD